MNNTPLFPSFKKLSLKDKSIIESFTVQFPPYSDFYFFSLWSYNVNENIEYSFLNQNLVMKFQEYTGQGYFYSFLGNSKPVDTIRQLLSHAQQNKLLPSLKLVPEHSLHGTDLESLRHKYDIEEDSDNFDYILSVEKISQMNGPELHQKKKQMKKFLQNYQSHIQIVPLKDIRHHESILTLLNQWVFLKKSGDVNKNELEAIKRSIVHSHAFDIQAFCVYVDEKLRGFTIFEYSHPEIAISSFQKADTKFEGIYEFLNWELAKYLKEKNCKFINIEQDLGIAGLRQAKRKYNPTYLKKYIISPKS